jgi:CheY-like chemotaxis protein
MVIISAVMPDLSGIDLAIALAAMPATRNVSTALITSLDDDDEYLRLLPGSVPVIHKGASFGDDIAEALSRLFLI